MKRIGIFAGVFDPIHLGHIEFIKKVIKENKLDKVYILVEQEPRFKICLASYEHRKKMTELAIKGIPKAEIYEPAAKSFPITSSLPEIRKANPDTGIFLLLGDDVAEHINKWPDAQRLLKGVELVVAERNRDDSLSQVSSLKVRKQIKDGDDTGLDLKVLGYIRANNLY